MQSQVDQRVAIACQPLVLLPTKRAESFALTFLRSQVIWKHLPQKSGALGTLQTPEEHRNILSSVCRAFKLEPREAFKSRNVSRDLRGNGYFRCSGLLWCLVKICLSTSPLQLVTSQFKLKGGNFHIIIKLFFYGETFMYLYVSMWPIQFDF